MMKRFGIFAAAVVSGTLMGQVLIYDQGFDRFRPDGIPNAWALSAQAGGKVTVAPDSKIKSSGEFSARITVEKAPAGKMPHMLFQRRNFQAQQVDRSCQYSFNVRGKNLKGAQIVFVGHSPEKKHLIWQSIKLPDGDFEWQKISGNFVVPAGVNSIICYIRIKNPGTLWVDDAHAEVVKLIPNAAGFIRNSGFEEVDAKGNPLYWKRRLHPLGKAVVTTDTTVKFSGSRSLRIHGGAALKNLAQNHAVFQSRSFSPATTKDGYCRFSFKLRGEELKRPQVVVIARGGGNPHLVWKAFALPEGTFDWQDFSCVVRIPAGAEMIIPEIRLRSMGNLWVDDVCADYFEFAPQGFDFSGKKNTVSGLPGAWQVKTFFGNENTSSADVIAENGKNIVIQKWLSGTPLAGLKHPLADYWLCAPAFEISGRGKGEFKVGVEFYDHSGALIGDVVSNEMKSADWQDYSLKVIPPAKAARADLVLLNCGKTVTAFDGVNISMCDSAGALKVEFPALNVNVWPVEYSLLQHQVKTPEFNTFTDSPNKLHFSFRADRKRLKDPALVIDLPADVRIADAYCPHISPENWGQEKFTVTPLKRQEGDYRRYRFSSLRALTFALPDRKIFGCSAVVLLLPEKEGSVFNGKKVFYHLENDGKAMAEHSFLLNMLPALPKTPNPKRFAFIRWNDEELSVPDDAVFMKSIRQLEETGYTWCTRNDGSLPVWFRQRTMLESRGWRFFIRRAALNIHMRNSASSATKLKVPAPIMADGTVKAGTEMCPTFMTCDPEFVGRYKKYLRKKISSYKYNKNDWVIIDSEQFRPMDWCFCELCRSEFSKRQKSAKVLTTAEILKDHREAWRDFRLSHDTGFLKMVAETVDEFGLKVVDYNYIIDYSVPDYKEKFYDVSKDARANDIWQGAHLPSYYHCHEAKAFDAMLAGRSVLKKPYYPMCGISADPVWQSPAEVLTPARFRMMMLSAAATGCSGLAVYNGEYIDAKFMQTADQTMAEIAAVEDILLDGKVVPCDVQADMPNANENFRFICREYNGRKIVAVLNYHFTAPADVTITCDGKKIKMTLPPLDGKFVEIK